MMDSRELEQLVMDALEEMKAVDVRVLDVHEQSSFTDTMIVAGGTSSRHAQSVADNVVRRAKERGNPPLGVEGEREGEWILVDLGDVVVHVMQPQVRDFYNLEKLWTTGVEAESSRAR